uniref:Beta-1,4-mannosyl-glycoprotein beta-1,4-N-acetylglucosaminyltransferase n=1 Tax=Rhipicephalus appendiculatus TaxID=34631 RepID=A0A131Z1L7_RHIAP
MVMSRRFGRTYTFFCLFGFASVAILFGALHLERTRKKGTHKNSAKEPVAARGTFDIEHGKRVPETKSATVSSGVAWIQHEDDDVSNRSTCFLEGTVRQRNNLSCICKKGWNGADCSIPDAIWSTKAFRYWNSAGLIRRRRKPRAVINGFIFNHELDILEVRIKELGNAVDYFIIVESIYTNVGAEKPLYLKSNLSAGFLREHAHKIIPIAMDFYNYIDGEPWSPENYLRSSIWYEGQRRLRNIQRDDLFIMSDADEIPSREVVLFLKHHDGYGEPILLRLRWFLYGFFWENREPVNVSSVCTVAFMREKYENDSLRLRTLNPYTDEDLPEAGTFIDMWTIEGTPPRYAGWHCSWCFDAHGIQVKLASAQRDDGVRWGDIAEKTDIAYINSLRRRGQYFDESTPLNHCDPYEAAPAYVAKHAQRFRHLMQP